MGVNPYGIEWINRLPRSELRELVFLTRSDGKLDAASVYAGMDAKEGREVRTRFDLWLAGGQHTSYFHGWPSHPQYGNCFCFRWKRKSVPQRFYGFLCHPQPKTKPRFQLCALLTHDSKTQWLTEPSHLSLATQLRSDPLVRQILNQHFPDTPNNKTEKPWTH